MIAAQYKLNGTQHIYQIETRINILEEYYMLTTFIPNLIVLVRYQLPEYKR